MTRIEMLKKELAAETAKQEQITNAFGAEFADPDLTARCLQLNTDIKALEAEAIKTEKAVKFINDIMKTAGLKYLPEEKTWISGKYPRGWEQSTSDTLRISATTKDTYTTAELSATWDPNNEINNAVGKNVIRFSLDGELTYVLKQDGIDNLLKSIGGDNPEFRKAELKWMLSQIEKILKQQGYKPVQG